MVSMLVQLGIKFILRLLTDDWIGNVKVVSLRVL